MKCSLLVLSSHLDGELEVRRQGELEAHLVGCQRCRSGLGYLREEVERVSALGRVRVAEHSMEALLVQLGLAEAPEDSVDMTGTPMPGGSYWAPPELAADETPSPDLADAAAPELIPSLPHAVPPAPPATAASPPTQVRQWPPPSIDPDPAPFAPPSAGAFPPGGPEPSEPPTHVTASGGDAEMTASPPWTPHREAPPEPTYPLTDEDVLDEPIPVERFGPPQQARPSFFERLRDRVAVRRALSRSTAEYDDSVQIVSGTGAPLRSGRARTEVERRRLDSIQPAAPAMVGAQPAEAAELSDPGDEVDLGPLPKTAPFVTPGGAHMPRPIQPGQLAIPGTDDHPARQVMGTPMPTRAETPPDRDEPPHPELPAAPPPRPDWPTPMRPNSPVPPPRHTLESAIGAPPPMAPRPTAPDPLAEALSEYERGRAASAEPRPWRPREIPEDMPQAEPAQPRGERAAPTVDRPRHSPSQLREGRRLLAIFGAATLVMLIVGVVSGRTTTPLPASNASSPSTQPSHAANPAPSQPAARASAAAPQASAAAPQASARPAQNPAPAGVPQLTGVKVLGDTGSGYQVSDFRYGQHPNDFRIVLDMGPAGSAAGTPKATVGFLDSTTLLVAIEGVVPAGSTGSLPPGSVATGVSLLQPSPFPNAVTYQIKVARAVTFSAGYVPGPLRLVLDLAG
ncbi:MAG TPA: hypothetical protein VN193_08585 [Candidatus Angelobacter sp.]|jgi:hypothetical protein|nr:hypothetical protein [Candidatus Angelobacter sp.]